MSTHYYRFRSTEALLDGYQELEKQEIYFASPEELNDPLEGLRDVTWSGDRIAWRNLFSHYLRCLSHAFTLWILQGENERIGWEQIPLVDPRTGTEGLPIEMLNDRIDAAFFGPDSDDYLDALATRDLPMRRDELQTHLLHLHPLAISTIYSCFQESKLIAPKPIDASLRENLSKTFPNLIQLARQVSNLSPESKFGGSALAALFAALRHSSSQLLLINQFNNSIDSSLNNKNFVFVRFPEDYVEKIQTLLHPRWYTACFMADCRNAALWAYYGSNHYGACLMFKSESIPSSTSDILNLERVSSESSSGPQRSFVPHEFKPVNYSDAHVEIDFFRSLGTLPWPTLNKNWYFDKDGRRSQCALDLGDDDAWRTRYWKAFSASATTKLRDWQGEQEHRLLLHSNMFDLSDRASRKLKYNFDSLDGIIFGIKTPLDKKIEICKIIQSKCAAVGRGKFKFYQAYFAPQKGTIEHAELSLLTFSRA